MRVGLIKVNNDASLTRVMDNKEEIEGTLEKGAIIWKNGMTWVKEEEEEVHGATKDAEGVNTTKLFSEML